MPLYLISTDVGFMLGADSEYIIPLKTLCLSRAFPMIVPLLCQTVKIEEKALPMERQTHQHQKLLAK